MNSRSWYPSNKRKWKQIPWNGNRNKERENNYSSKSSSHNWDSTTPNRREQDTTNRKSNPHNNRHSSRGRNRQRSPDRTSKKNIEKNSKRNSNRYTYRKSNTNIDNNSNRNSTRIRRRNTYKQNIQVNHGKNSNGTQRGSQDKNRENVVRTTGRRAFDSSKTWHYTQTKTYGFTSDPFNPLWKNIYLSYRIIPTKHYFNHTANTTYHNFCTYLQPPQMINILLGNNLIFCLQQKYSTCHLQDSIVRFKSDIHLKVIFQYSPSTKEYVPRLYIKSSYILPPLEKSL